MDSAARRELRQIFLEITDWIRLAERASTHLLALTTAANAVAGELRGRCVEVPNSGAPGWLVLVLGDSDADVLGTFARHGSLPTPDPRLLQRLTKSAPNLVETAKRVTGLRRFFLDTPAREGGRAAASELSELHRDIQASGLVADLERITAEALRGAPAPVPVARALDDEIGLADRLTTAATSQHLLDVAEFRGVGNAVATMLIALHTELEFRDAAHKAADTMRLAEATRILAEMPVERLGEAANGRLATSALRAAGVDSVLDVFERIGSLEEIHRVGPVQAQRLEAAARTIWRTTHESTPVHIDVVDRTAEATQLIARLGLWGQVRTLSDPATELARATAVRDLLAGIKPDTTHVVVLGRGGDDVDAFRRELADVLAKASRARVPAVPEMPDDPWADFLARPAHYYSLLSDLGFLAEKGESLHGDVPSEVVEAIRAFELDTEHLTASLRGYQDFAAKFALVQRRVLIGDEMGLGKTVEALAALAHLRAQGNTHFLVVAPAALVTNWMRETEVMTKLAAHRLHGPDRREALRRWRRDGGVGITSFGTLGWLLARDIPFGEVAAVVIDEAHYAKNPTARRTRRTAEVVEQVPHVIALTGTPLLNRVEEFRTLVGHLRPDIVAATTEQTTAHEFRQVVAPVYLRRNQEDVLTELPEMVEVEEWVSMTGTDLGHYRDAVEAGNFMAMRRAAALGGKTSGKLQRLAELVDEAVDNGRSVLVYSFFRDVLEAAASVLPGRVFGPLNGSVSPQIRQQVVDEFTAAPRGASLVAQITAVGVGMNIQAASVVVLLEPQLNPALEWQAIARAQRMGQVHSVQVHRLLSDEGVDPRLREVLAAKGQTFDEYARISDLAHGAPEAFDITEADLARRVVEEERSRLFGSEDC